MAVLPSGELQLTAATIAALAAGIVGIIGSLATGIATVIKAYQIQRSGQERSGQLDNITTLVDGRYAHLLQELADAKRMLASKTGLPEDEQRAAAAQRVADAQLDRVNEVARRQGKTNKGGRSEEPQSAIRNP